MGEPMLLLVACFQNGETQPLEMLIYPFSQSVSLLMAMKGKQTVEHPQGLAHQCRAQLVCAGL